MSVTINNLLNLPSLKAAEVCAGKQGLKNIVSSISVLEYAQPCSLQEELFNNKQFQGGEIVISALISIKDDVRAQCECIRRLHDAGEVGLILYYVGLFMKDIDKRVLQVADELDFPILCMPRKRMDLRYSEVIQEVMEAILKDRMVDSYIVTEMLERITRLPKHQRSMDSVLRMLADRTHLNLYLVDETCSVLNEASWPKKANFSFDELTDYCRTADYETCFCVRERPQELWMVRVRIVDEDSRMFLMMIREGQQVDKELMKQVQEVVQLFINIWSKSHGARRSDELIRSILQDEPVKMRHLADILHIQVETIHSMWMLQVDAKEHRQELLLQLQSVCDEFLHTHYHLVISAIVKDALIVFMGNEIISGNEELLGSLFLEKLKQKQLSAFICSSYSLQDTGHVRKAYMDILDTMDTARTIYPSKSFFSLSEIEFAKEMKLHVEQGESHLDELLHILSFETRDEKQREELLSTLCIYLLEGDMRMQKTADLLFLHKNTIKYRIQLLQEKLHMSIHKMPEALELYKACAIYRIMHQKR